MFVRTKKEMTILDRGLKWLFYNDNTGMFLIPNQVSAAFEYTYKENITHVFIAIGGL